MPLVRANGSAPNIAATHMWRRSAANTAVFSPGCALLCANACLVGGICRQRAIDGTTLAHSLTRSLTLCARRHQRLQIQYEAVGTAYANALVSTAQAKGELEAVHADIDAISSVMKESADIKEFLANPTVPEDKKKQMIAKMAAESGFNSYTVNFLNILVDQNRLDAISEVCDAFEVKYCQLTDTQVATLRSAVKLEQEQQFLIAKKLQVG